MSKAIELSEEQYATLAAAAARRNETPQDLVNHWVAVLAESQGPVYYTDDELLRALGADDAEIAELAKLEQQIDADE